MEDTSHGRGWFLLWRRREISLTFQYCRRDKSSVLRLPAFSVTRFDPRREWYLSIATVSAKFGSGYGIPTDATLTKHDVEGGNDR